MAHISKYKLQDGTVRYRFHVHRAGHHKLITKGGYKFKKDAERVATEQERSILLTGLPQSIDKLRIPFSVFVERYLKEIAPRQGSYATIKATLKKFLDEDNDYELPKMFVCHIKDKHVYEYIEARKKETWRGKLITNSTIKHDITIFSSVYGAIKKPWCYDGHEQLPPNPFQKLDKKTLEGSMRRRKRRLKEGELERLEQACEKCLGLNRFYVPLAIYLAIDTGMRQQEIFNLTWQDVDLKKRRIEIVKSKTDHLTKHPGRTIVLPFNSMWRLLRLETHLMRFEPKRYAPDALIFPMTKGAFKQSWADVRKRAGIKGLWSHDLRHEAASRFDEADLSTPQRNLMMGHADPSIGDGYVHSDHKIIQDKLDRHVLGGKTFDEWMAAGDDKAGLEGLADILEGKAGDEELRALVAQDLSTLMPPRLKAEVAQVLKGRSQKAAANVVQFSKAKAS
jgi:integrase